MWYGDGGGGDQRSSEDRTRERGWRGGWSANGGYCRCVGGSAPWCEDDHERGEFLNWANSLFVVD